MEPIFFEEIDDLESTNPEVMIEPSFTDEEPRQIFHPEVMLDSPLDDDRPRQGVRAKRITNHSFVPSSRPRHKIRWKVLS